MDYPTDCKSPNDKTEYLYRAQELLRFLHNKFVDWREEGFSPAQYDSLPIIMKDKFPYEPKITMETWQQFHDEDFFPMSEVLCNEIVTQRNIFKQSTRWGNDVFANIVGEPPGLLTRIWNFLNKPL